MEILGSGGMGVGSGNHESGGMGVRSKPMDCTPKTVKRICQPGPANGVYFYEQRTPIMRQPDGTFRHLRKSINQPGHAHELTLSCYQSLPLFNLDPVRQFMVDALVRARARHAIQLWAYVIMPTHVHVLLKPLAATYRMAVILNAIKYPVVFRALRHFKESKPTIVVQLATKGANGCQELRFWQRGGGYDRNLANSKSIRASIDYIHNNPVGAGLVTSPEDWEWSSARWYAGMKNVPLKMDPPLI